MILERRPIPPGAPPEFHGLARVLAAVAGPAEPGDLAGQDAAHAAFTRLASRPGTSHAALRSARRSLSERPARGRLPLAAALAVAAAGLGSTAAAFPACCPARFSTSRTRRSGRHHHLVVSPRVRSRSPAHRCPGTPGPAIRGTKQPAASSDPVSDRTHRGPLPLTGGRDTAPCRTRRCVPLGQDRGWAVGTPRTRPGPARFRTR